jgi:hypothetical protein
MATFLPLGFLTGWVASFVLRKLNLLRVPPEVELAGLDTVEFAPDMYFPEVGRRPEAFVEPDGTIVEAAPLILEEALEATGDGRERPRRVTR